jgi:serine phosphatase RsbU (regulator of sigma subunit)
VEELIMAGLEWCVAARTLPGEANSGDHHLVLDQSPGALLAAVDGLGHGSEAAAAAEIAVRTLRQNAQESIVNLVGRCHQELRGTRGVVMSLASYDARDGTLTWLGVGNVVGLVLRSALESKPLAVRLLLCSGVVGRKLPALHVATFPVRPGDTLVFATDGVECNFDTDLDTDQPIQMLAERIIEQHGRSDDDALALIARFPDGRS